MAGSDHLIGGDGVDILDGGAGVDTMEGGTGGDTFTVDDAGDVIIESTLATGGIDTVKLMFNSVTGFTSYTLVDGLEKLTIGGGAGTGTGNGAANTMLGFTGNDTLYGLGGNDTLTGGSGDDFLYGGAGLDQLSGGIGADHFILDGPSGTSADKIMDFASLASGASVLDKLGIVGTDYGLATGALDASRFVAGTSATSAAGVGQFVYNSTNKTLYWDADGSGAGAAVIVATFATAVNLGASDFVVM